MLSKKTLKTDNLELEYIHYVYDHYVSELNLFREYKRYKYFKHFENYVSNLLNIIDKDRIISLVLYGIANNLNHLDPVLVYIDKKGLSTILKNSKRYSTNEIYVIINKINMQVNNYVSKLSVINEHVNNKIHDFDKKFQVTKHDDVIFYVEDFEYTKIKISDFLYKKLVDKYKIFMDQVEININNLDKLIWSILFRYKYLSLLDSFQGFVPKKELLEKNKKYEFNLELFASVFNSYTKYFCSIFYDLERHFGCVGNFFNLKVIKGSCFLFPPSINWIIKKSSKIIENWFDTTSQKIFIIGLLPVVDDYDWKILEKLCGYEFNPYGVNYNYQLRNSKYILLDRLYCKNTMKFEKFININEQTEYEARYKKGDMSPALNVIIMSNYNVKFDLSFLPNHFYDKINKM